MTLLEGIADQTRREQTLPVLKTERLTLRVPRRGDARAIAAMVNDRRIAANTARIPHPYSIADAEEFIASVNRRDGETCFVMMLGDRLIGACGLESARGRARAGLLARGAVLGPALCDGSCARGDRLRLRGA